MTRCSAHLLIATLALAVVCSSPGHADEATASRLAGLTLQALSDADLDVVQQKTGYRVGVLVAAVADGSAAAAAGLRVGDVLFIVGESGVDSPAAVDQALTGKTGQVRVAGLRPKPDGTGEVVELSLNMPQPGAPPQAPTAATAPAAAPPPVPPAQTQAKLDALDAALAAGVLTREEYDRKRAEILAQAAPPMPDADTQARLAALEAARQAGILGEAEYQQKRAALLGPTGAPGPPVGLTVYADPQGRFSLGYPAGWQPKLREDRNGVDLVKGPISGSIMAFAGQGTSDDLLNGLIGPIREQTRQFAEVRRGQVAIGAATGPWYEYTGVNPQGAQCHVAVAASAGGGMGFAFMLVAPPGDFAAVQEDWRAVLKSFSRPGAPPAGAPAEPTASTSGDPFMAYFDMLDFMRSQAWGVSVNTPPDHRQRLLAMLDQEAPQARAKLLQALQPVPQAWADLQNRWNGATEEKRSQQREHWRGQLLLPTVLFPPPLETDTFRGRNDRVVFEHPRGWVIAQTEDEDTQFLYLGPPGTETSWEQVLDPAGGPPGALLAIMPIPDELKQVGSHADAARLLAQQYVATPGAELREVGAADVGEGAIVTYRVRYPGQSEDRFYWVGAVRYGSGSVLAGRMGGPLSRADQLVPAFSYLVMTMELSPPDGGGGDYGSAMVDYYAAKAGNIAVSGGW